MASTQITITTEQAQRLADLRDENHAESIRLINAAPEATERRRPGMLARSQELSAIVELLNDLLAQVPDDVLNPPPPPDWVADGFALVPGERWPHRLNDDGLWEHPDSLYDSLSHSQWYDAATTEHLIEAGAQRLPAVLAALGLLDEQKAADDEPTDDSETDAHDENDDEGDDEDSESAEVSMPRLHAGD